MDLRKEETEIRNYFTKDGMREHDADVRHQTLTEAISVVGEDEKDPVIVGIITDPLTQEYAYKGRNLLRQEIRARLERLREVK